MLEYKRGLGKLCGVYQIRNLVNNKIYVGSASQKLSNRKNNHFTLLGKGKHANSHLQRAWNKYGKTSFIFEIIEICSSEDCLIREQFFIDTLKPQYNLLKIAGSNKGIKLSEARKLAVSLRHKGKVVSEETRLKISTASKGRIGNRKGTVCSQETKNRIGLANKGRVQTTEEKLKRSLSGKIAKNKYLKK